MQDNVEAQLVLCSGSGRDPRAVWTRRAKRLELSSSSPPSPLPLLRFPLLIIPIDRSAPLVHVRGGFAIGRPVLSLINPGVIVSSLGTLACIITSLRYIRSASGIAGPLLPSVPPTRPLR